MRYLLCPIIILITIVCVSITIVCVSIEKTVESKQNRTIQNYPTTKRKLESTKEKEKKFDPVSEVGNRSLIGERVWLGCGPIYGIEEDTELKDYSYIFHFNYKALNGRLPSIKKLVVVKVYFKEDQSLLRKNFELSRKPRSKRQAEVKLLLLTIKGKIVNVSKDHFTIEDAEIIENK